MVAILVYGVVIIGNSVYFAIAGGGCHVDDLGALLLWSSNRRSGYRSNSPNP